MDIFNRPPAIAEDTLCYSLYPPQNLADRASATTFAACILAYVDSLLPGFIWHRDSFEVKVAPDPDSKSWMLEGTLRVGDCIDDEWCTVWLLREISTKWDLAISVYDSDGEFLLIEAAETLPSWVKPSNTENRVWIYGARLHLIPLSYVSPPSTRRRRRLVPGVEDEAIHDENDDEFVSVPDALKLLRDSSVTTLAPTQTEAAVWARISGYPTAANSHIHRTNAYLPSDIAKALSIDPPLIQKAVETFYTRDAVQLRAAHRMSRFPPGTCILTSVKMTRPAYAQLIGQKFYPPKVFGTWKESEGSKEWRWKDVGMKIAVGFEILFQESKGSAEKVNTTVDGLRSSADAKIDALRRTTEYQKYIQNLMSAGYFRGEIEGSQLWNDLEEKAATAFVEARQEDDAKRVPFAVRVNSALSRATEPLTPSEEDDNSWLDLDAANFEDMLQKRMVESKGKAKDDPNAMEVDEPAAESVEDRLASEQTSRLKKLAEQVGQFVEGEGDLEGAKFSDEEFSDEEFSEESSSDESDDNDHILDDSVARQKAMDKLVPALDAAEYGQMPSSYSKSQSTARTTVQNDTITSEEPQNTHQSASNGSESKPYSRPIRQPILTRNKYDGVDSDDETDDEDDSESEEERPQVVGDVEIDMEEEEDEFLEFSRQALGISDEQWKDIIRDRKERGAFIPASIPSLPKKASADPPAVSTSSIPRPEARPGTNPNLDSFEAVMQAMDAELARNKKAKSAPKVSKQPTAKVKEDEDIEAAMDAELKAALHSGEDGDDDVEGDESVDYNLIKNFLESFKSQGGLSGPVGTLAGRLQPGWKIPRDES